MAHILRPLLQGDSTQTERMRTLKQQRDKTLDQIHFRARRLDRPGYLRHQNRKESEKGT